MTTNADFYAMADQVAKASRTTMKREHIAMVLALIDPLMDEIVALAREVEAVKRALAEKAEPVPVFAGLPEVEVARVVEAEREEPLDLVYAAMS